MFKLKIFSLAMGLLGAATLCAQTEVRPYKPGVTPEGITYFLPKTALHVTLTATRTIKTPGEYAAYAERYLRLKGVPQQMEESWELTAVNVTPFGKADTKQAYTIELNPKSSAPLVNLAADGRLLGVNTKNVPAEPTLTRPSVKAVEQESINGADFKTEEILAAGSKSKMAELTANEIYDIRENRSLLMKGQADFMPKDGEQLRLMLAELDAQEAGLLQLFKGTQRQEVHTFTLEYVPSDKVGKDILFRFSKHLGLVEKDDLAGEPYYISISDPQTMAAAVQPAEGKAKKEILDLRYIVPGRATVSITNAVQNFYNASVPMAQFGRVEHLGGDLFNKKFTTSVVLSPQTGGIQHIDMEQPK